MNILLVSAGILLCLIFSGFCSSAEMAYSSCNPMRLETLRDAGNKRAALALKILDRFDDALSAILIGNNLANIGGSSLASVLVILLTGSEDMTWLATVILTILVIVFAETLPKILAKKNAVSKALAHAYPVRAIMILLGPLVWVVVKLIRLLTAGIRDRGEGSAEEKVEELQYIIETAEDEDVLNEEQSELLRSAIDFADVSVSEVMTARVDVFALDIDDDWSSTVRKIEEETYSRIPVYEGSIDNIVGVLYQNHFLKALTEGGDVSLRSLLMPPCFVYKTVKLPAVLSMLRRERQHLAIVTDEYGGTLGVVSMEDVLEQIVGEIWDEDDEIEQEIVEKTEGEFELDGSMPIGDFMEKFSLDEEKLQPESDTVGGWTIERFGSFPKEGDSFRYDDLELTVLDMADGRRVERVLVRKSRPEDGKKN